MTWADFAIMLLMWLATLSGVAVGGWLVYRTKRDPYDPLFMTNQKGDSFNLDDDLSTGQDNPVLPREMMERNRKFQEQFDVETFAKGIGDKAKE